MSNYVIAAPAVPAVPVDGESGLFPLRRIYCVGRNYAAHAREMGSDPTREPPFFFCKPADAVLPVAPGVTGDLPYPQATDNFQYEIELVVAIGIGGADIAEADALSHVWGYTAGLDMTRRDLQFALRDLGRPWELGKAFDHSAPLAPIVPLSRSGHPAHAAIWLKLNGELRQSAAIADMSWSVAEIIARLSTYFCLAPGDLIFTGTPAGVGPVVKGDLIEAGVDGLGTLALRVV
jgi:fumarylpyruvate hydrolase